MNIIIDLEAKKVEKVLNEVHPTQKKIMALKKFRDLVNSEYNRLKVRPNNEASSEQFNRLGYLSVGLNLIDLDDFDINDCESTRRTLLFHFDPTRDEEHQVSSEIHWIDKQLANMCGGRSEMTKENF